MIDHRFRLRAIELREFKSIRNQRVDLGPLTVVVGANSAGKSTLLQAILALSQAVRSDGATSEFPLNGSLIRLGTFDETRNYLAAGDTPQIEIKFELIDNSPVSDFVAAELEMEFDGETLASRGRREPATGQLARLRWANRRRGKQRLAVQARVRRDYAPRALGWENLDLRIRRQRRAAIRLRHQPDRRPNRCG